MLVPMSQPDEWVGHTLPKQHTGTPNMQDLQDPKARNSLALPTHMTDMNDHVVTGPLQAGKTVFDYKPLPKGPMAEITTSPGSTAVPKQEPGGRTRSVEGFFE